MLTMTKDDYEKILAHCKEGLPNHPKRTSVWHTIPK